MTASPVKVTIASAIHGPRVWTRVGVRRHVTRDGQINLGALCNVLRQFHFHVVAASPTIRTGPVLPPGRVIRKRAIMGLSHQNKSDEVVMRSGKRPRLLFSANLLRFPAKRPRQARRKRVQRKPCPPRPRPDASALLLAGKDERLAALLDHVELRIGAQLRHELVVRQLRRRWRARRDRGRRFPGLVSVVQVIGGSIKK